MAAPKNLDRSREIGNQKYPGRGLRRRPKKRRDSPPPQVDNKATPTPRGKNNWADTISRDPESTARRSGEAKLPLKNTPRGDQYWGDKQSRPNDRRTGDVRVLLKSTSHGGQQFWSVKSSRQKPTPRGANDWADRAPRSSPAAHPTGRLVGDATTRHNPTPRGANDWADQPPRPSKSTQKNIPRDDHGRSNMETRPSSTDRQVDILHPATVKAMWREVCPPDFVRRRQLTKVRTAGFCTAVERLLALQAHQELQVEGVDKQPRSENDPDYTVCTELFPREKNAGQRRQELRSPPRVLPD